MKLKPFGPAEFLTQRIEALGQTEYEGVSLSNVTVSANAETNYYGEPGSIEGWKELAEELSRAFEDPNTFVNGLVLDGSNIAFYRRGSKMDMIVQLPYLAMGSFRNLVVSMQALLLNLTSLLPDTTGTIYFHVGVAILKWETEEND